MEERVGVWEREGEVRGCAMEEYHMARKTTNANMRVDTMYTLSCGCNHTYSAFFGPNTSKMLTCNHWAGTLN